MGFSDMRTVHSNKFGVDIEYYKTDIDTAVYGPGCEEVWIFGCGYDDGKTYNLHFVADDDEWESCHYDDEGTEPIEGGINCGEC